MLGDDAITAADSLAGIGRLWAYRRAVAEFSIAPNF